MGRAVSLFIILTTNKQAGIVLVYNNLPVPKQVRILSWMAKTRLRRLEHFHFYLGTKVLTKQKKNCFVATMEILNSGN